MFTTQFFIEESYFGEGSRGFIAGDPRLGPARSTIWFCTACGQVYGRVVVQAAPCWEASHACCRQCKGGAYTVPGSIWRSWDPEYIEGLSREALEREFDLHLAHFAPHLLKGEA